MQLNNNCSRFNVINSDANNAFCHSLSMFQLINKNRNNIINIKIIFLGKIL